MTKPQRLDVMVSSTSLDLPRHREQARAGIMRAGHHPIGMETLSAANQNAVDVSLALVEEAEVYVGIFGQRYGYRPVDPRNPDDLSITEMEYRHAKSLGMPILIYCMHAEHPAPDTAGMSAAEGRAVYDNFYESDPTGRDLLDKLRNALGVEYVIGFYKSPEDLRGLISDSLREKKLIDQAYAYAEKRAAAAAAPAAAASAAPSPAAPTIPLPPDLYAKPSYPGAGAIFSGRRDELDALSAWGRADSPHALCVVEAIGGMGKSALAWQWVQDRAVPFDGVFWYSFYEGGADMTDFARHALAYLTRRDPDALKGGAFSDQFAQVIAALKKSRHLLVLDGLERVLVAYNRWDAAQMQDDTVEEGKDDRACANPRDDDALAQLASAAPSRILITSRLLPTALTDSGAPLASVRYLPLRGLSRADARALWTRIGVKWTNEALLDGFFEQIGRHGLLLKVSAAAIMTDFKRARGNFDAWHADTDIAAVFARADVKGKRHHILAVAYQGLSAEGRELLAQIAAFGAGVGFAALNVFNPFLPLQPEKVEAPPRFMRAEQKAQHQAEYDAYRAAVSAWERSPAYKAAVRRFEGLLDDLEDRGLLWWDAAHDLYDLHPVVRGYAYAALDPDARKLRHTRAYDLFDEQERAAPGGTPRVLADLALPLAMYDALIGAGRLDDAAELYAVRLGYPLYYSFAAYARIYALLLPLFPDGLDRPPALTEARWQGSIASRMAIALSGLRRDDEALRLEGLVIGIYVAAADAPNLSAALNNYAASLESLSRIALALRTYEDALALAAAADDRDRAAIAHMYLHSLYSDLGWTERADAARAAFESAPPAANTLTWRLTVARDHAWSLFRRGADDAAVRAALTEAERLAEAAQSSLDTRELAQLRAEMALRAGDAAGAVAAFSEAIERGHASGVRYAEAFGGLARAYAANGRLRDALRIVSDGCDSYSAAVVLAAAGERDGAIARAVKLYTWAWADGEPYVWRYYLDQAAALLGDLGVPLPDLPAIDEAAVGAYPHQDAVRAFIARLRDAS